MVTRLTALALGLLLSACSSSGTAPDGPHASGANAAVALEATQTRPLAVGQMAPDASILSADGRHVRLSERLSRGPTLLVVYRGGWCPFCTAHLAELARIEKDLTGMGLQILAVSPDRPELLAQEGYAKGAEFNYELLSDQNIELARAFGLAFQVDAPTVELYRGYGIDLQQASGRPHQVLPVPAVYMIDSSGQIRFAHADPDYRERLDGAAVLAAARTMVGG